MKKYISLILIVCIFLTGCGKQEIHTYKEVINYLNYYDVSAYPMQKQRLNIANLYDYKLELKNKFTYIKGEKTVLGLDSDTNKNRDEYT